MYLEEHSIRSSLMLIAIVIALSALIGLGLPAFSDKQPAGSDSVAEAWFTPAPTATATAALQPSPTNQPTATAAVVDQHKPAGSATKTAYVALDTATPVPQLLVMQPMPSAEAATPTAVDVPRRNERTPALTAASVAPTEVVTVRQPPTVVVPIPVARGPNGALGASQAVAAQPRLTQTPAVTPLPVGTVFAATLQSQPSARRLDAAPARTAVATPQSIQPAAPAPQLTQRLSPAPQPPTVTKPDVPELISPPADARLSGMATFEWRPAAQLAPGTGYEIVVWSPDQDPGQARGIAPATVMTSQQVNLDPLFESGLFRMGNLYWTVLVVQQDPYLRLTAPGEGEHRYLVRRTGG